MPDNGAGAAAFRVQNQIRRNAQDMQEYLADLGSWEKSIKKKDKQLSRKATSNSTVSSSSIKAKGGAATGTPPIRRSGGPIPIKSGPTPRSSEEGKPASKKANDAAIDGQRGEAGVNRQKEEGKGATTLSTSAAGHTHDKGYNKWAKFDIDAALRSVDADGEADKARGTSNSDSDTDSEEEDKTVLPPRLTPATMVDRSSGQQARRNATVARPATGPAATRPISSPRDLEKEERERGNAMFGRGDFQGAVKCYTRCVGMNSKSSLAFSNRAMAYLKLKEFGKAEADGDAALRVDPRHLKSLQRRAAARNALGKHRAALGDLQTAAKLDPSSKEIRKDLNKTLETLKTVTRRAPKRRVRVENEPLPASKPRGYPSLSSADERSLAPSPSASPATPVIAGATNAAASAASAATATSTDGAFTAAAGTVAPFASVLRKQTGGVSDGGGEGFPLAHGTTVEVLPDEGNSEVLAASSFASPSSSSSLSSATAPASSVQPTIEQITSHPVMDYRDGGTARQVDSLVNVNKNEGDHKTRGSGFTAEAGGTRPPEVTGSAAEAGASPTAAAVRTTVARAAPPSKANDGAVARPPAPPPLAAAASVTPGPDLSPAVSVKVAEANDKGTSDAAIVALSSRAKHSSSTAGGGTDSTPEVAHPAGGETATTAVKFPQGGGDNNKNSGKAQSAPVQDKRRPKKKSAARKNDIASCASGASRGKQQPPTSGYQFEHMWRSTDGKPEARLELLRAIPPSSISKIFRRTPIEVELLGGILEHLERAFLPGLPATALRWLKALSKGSRFGMTVSLLGEGDGRGATRELLARLEAAATAEPEDLEALRKQYLLY